MPKHAVIVIGRFQPPTAGHHKMVQHAINLANIMDAICTYMVCDGFSGIVPNKNWNHFLSISSSTQFSPY